MFFGIMFSVDILEVRVIDGESLKILGTSDPDNQGLSVKESTELRIQRVIAIGGTRQ